ncbi:ANGEL1.2 family protein [Megaselia abdita]
MGDWSRNDPYNDTYSIFRQWQYTPLANYVRTTNHPGQNFTFISYNILAQDLLEEHSHIYKYHDSRFMNWTTRLQNLQREILTLRPDILCLQEVQSDHLSTIVESLNRLNMSYVYKKKVSFRNDGCAILFNRNLFQLIFKRTVEYLQPKGADHLDRDNVGLIAKFQLIGNPNVTFLIATTHLLYNPRREDVRLAQIQLLLAEIDRYSIDDDGKRIPVILSGDFNSVPESATLHLLKNGHLNYENLSRNTLSLDDNQGIVGKVFLPSSIGITDSCQHVDLVNSHYKANRTRIFNSEYANNTGNVEEDLQAKFPDQFSTGNLTHDFKFSTPQPLGVNQASTFQEEWLNVDYIFYSGSELKLVANYNLPTKENCSRMGFIPNRDLGSDHLSMGAKFFLEHN